MLPCPKCKQLCAARDVVLRSDRLFDRCSRCVDGRSFSTWVASREETPTVPMGSRSNEGTIELQAADLEVVSSLTRTLRMPSVPARAKPAPVFPTARSALAWGFGGVIIAGIWSAAVLAIQVDYPPPRKAVRCPSAETVLELDATP